MDKDRPLTVRVTLTLTQEQVDRLVHKALLRGFPRTRPCRAWTIKERRQAVGYLVVDKVAALAKA